MIEIGRAEMKKDGTGVLNGMLVRTEKNGGEVFFVHVTNGDEVVLNVTQILKDLGWVPVAGMPMHMPQSPAETYTQAELDQAQKQAAAIAATLRLE